MIERIGDDGDISSKQEQETIERALENRIVYDNKGIKECTDCGEDIESERFKLGFSKCISCAEISEIKNRNK